MLAVGGGLFAKHLSPPRARGNASHGSGQSVEGAKVGWSPTVVSVRGAGAGASGSAGGEQQSHCPLQGPPHSPPVQHDCSAELEAQQKVGFAGRGWQQPTVQQPAGAAGLETPHEIQLQPVSKSLGKPAPSAAVRTSAEVRYRRSNIGPECESCLLGRKYTAAACGNYRRICLPRQVSLVRFGATWRRAGRERSGVKNGPFPGE